MDNRQFDEQLIQELTALEPRHLPDKPTDPWWRVMGYLIWGIALTTIQVQLFWLQYVTASIGTLLLYLFYRSLRRENRWFRMGWVISIYFFLVTFGQTVFAATSFSERVPAGVTVTFAALGVILSTVRLYCLWRGLLEVQEKAGEKEPTAKPVVALMVFQFLLIPVTLFLGLFGLLLDVVVLVCILRSLRTMSHEMDDAGLGIEAAQVKVSDTVATGAYVAITAVAVLVCLINCRYPMEYNPVNDSRAGLEAVEDSLLALGFPEDILADLSDGDLARLEGATRVELRTGGRYDDELIRQTMVAVELPAVAEGSLSRWVFICHGQWKQAPDFCGVEACCVYPIAGSLGWGGFDEDSLSGQVLYTQAGESYCSDFYDIRKADDNNGDWTAYFSLSPQGEDQRWYIMYHADLYDAGWSNNCGYGYTRQMTRWVYPFRTPSLGMDGDAFRGIQAISTFVANEPGEEDGG